MTYFGLGTKVNLTLSNYYLNKSMEALTDRSDMKIALYLWKIYCTLLNLSDNIFDPLFII